MRIAMLTNNYKPFIGGVPISIERLAKGLRELGHIVYIFAPTYENQVEEENVIRYKVIKTKVGEGKIVVPNVFDSDIEKVFKTLEIDVIHVHHPMLMGNLALHLKRKYGIPVVLTYHTRYEQYLHYIKPYKFLEDRMKIEQNHVLEGIESKILNCTKEKILPHYIKSFADKCDLVISPTELMKNYLENIGVSSAIEVMPTGLEKRYFQGNDFVSDNIRKTYKGEKKYLFCTVSRLTKEKNIEFIFQGLKILKESMGNCFNMIIIGEGPLKEELEHKAITLGISENIIFLNSISNETIGDYYRACDMFLFGSKSETQGIVLLEAMAAQNPVVAVRATGVADIVEDGVNGYMTVENPSIWSNAIEKILKNEILMKNLQKGAYETAHRYLNFNIAKLAERNYGKVIRHHYKEGGACAYKISMG